MDWYAVYNSHQKCFSVLQAAVFTDPVSFEIRNPLNNLFTPALIYGTELAGACVSEGLTFDTFYEKWFCTKIYHVVRVSLVNDYCDVSQWLGKAVDKERQPAILSFNSIYTFISDIITFEAALITMCSFYT